MEHTPNLEIDGRTYDVLPEDSEVTFLNETISLLELASRFMPSFHMPEGVTAPDAHHTWYEVVDGEDCYVIAYHGVWENEQHPNEVIHKLYEDYRKKRYGSEMDIEHVTIRVSKTTGEIDGIWYEDTLSPGYNLWGSPHLYTEIVRGEDGRYIQHMSPIKDKRVVSRPIDWNGKTLNFAIASWSRQFRLMHSMPEKDRRRYRMTPQEMPLQYMTQQMYASQKLGRRSTGNPGKIARMTLQELHKKVPEYGAAQGVYDELLFAV